MKTLRKRLPVIALVVAAIVVGYLVTSSGDEGHEVKAELANAGGLRIHSSVKIAGVSAGKVAKIEITDRDTALATLTIDDEAWPIGQDAQLNVRPTDLLGERYAEIKTGDTERPMAEGATIPTARTAVPVELDDVLNMLDLDTRQRLGIVINEVGVAMTKRGTDFNQLLAQLPPSLHETEKLLEQIGAENRALKAGIERGDRVTAAVSLKRNDMGELIKEASEALQVVAERRAALGETIRNAPGALTQLRATLTSLDAASEHLRPAAYDLRATAEPLKETLEALPGFVDEARPALDKAKDISPALSRLARRATPTVRKLEPTVKNTATLLKGTAPILNQLDRRGWDDLMFFINNFNLGLRGRDMIGHMIGAKLNISAEYIDNAIENFTNVNLTPSRKAKPRKAAPPKPAAEQAPSEKPAAPSKPEPAKPVQDLVQGAGDAIDQLVPGATQGVCNLVEDIGNLLGGSKRENCEKQAAAAQSRQQQNPSGDTDALRLFDYLMGQ